MDTKTEEVAPNCSMISNIGNNSTLLSMPNRTIDATDPTTLTGATPLRSCGINKRKSDSNEHNELVDAINLKQVKMAGLFLDGCGIYLAGFGTKQREKLCKVLSFNGATRYDDVSERVTHVIVGDPSCQDLKLLYSRGVLNNCPLVSIQWLLDSITRQSLIDEENYIISAVDNLANEPSSPLSKKSFHMLRTKSNTPVVEKPADVPMPSPQAAPEVDIVQQYLKPTTSTQDVLAKFLEDDEFEPQEQANESSEQADKKNESSFAKPQNPSLADRDVSSAVDDDSSQPTDPLFEGIKFIIVGFTEELQIKVQRAIEILHGKVVSKFYKGIPDYAVLPVFSSELKQVATQVVNELWIADCWEENKIHPVEYFHQPISIKDDAQPLKDCIVSISSYTNYERHFLKNLIVQLGGISQESFSRTTSAKTNLLACTHLVSPEANGKKYTAAIKWGLPVLNKDWLLECARLSQYAVEEPYLVGEAKCSARSKEISESSTAITKSSTRLCSPKRGPSDLNDTEVNKRKFMDAVHNGDVKTAKRLISEGINVNFNLDHCSPLHAALLQESMDMLELLLSQPNIDLNIKNEMKDTPLVWGLRFFVPGSELFVLRLIRAGCDINISGKYGETPLELCLSLEYPTMVSITHELLKQGANVNEFCPECGTPLHHGVEMGNLELVCMLLYYNADVYIKWEGHTPFSLALYKNEFEIVEVLSDYYSFLDDDINYIIDNDQVCFAFLKYTNAELFKAVWPRFDPEVILSSCPAFIEYYLKRCNYSISDWVECLYLILNSDTAFDLIEHTGNFFNKLLGSMRQKHVQSEDRIGLLYMVLRLGFEIKINDINTAVAIYGLNQDLEPLIYHTYSYITNGSKFICPLHAFVIGMQTDYSIKKISQLFYHTEDEWSKQYYWAVPGFHKICKLRFPETSIKQVAFFSFSANVKNYIIDLYVDLYSDLCFDVSFVDVDYYAYRAMLTERLHEIPEFPSLTELSRNQTHKYLVEKFRFKQPYQLEDCVKKLLIPNKIKDIILFKEPIY